MFADTIVVSQKERKRSMKKKIVSLLLVVVLVLSLSACGGGDEAKLVGQWKCEKEFAEQFNEEMGLDEELAQYLSIDSFKLTLCMEFHEDGTYAMYADKDALNEAVQAVRDMLVDGMGRYLVDMVQAETGMEMDLDAILEMAGMSLEELIDESIPDDLVDEIADEMKQEGKFKAKDGKLYTSDGLEYDVDPRVYETYELSGDTLTIMGLVGAEDDAAFGVYPMTFQKAG